MRQVLDIWNASVLGRLLAAVCLWFGRQWEGSWVIRRFLSPMAGEESSRSSVFFRLWTWVRRWLSRLYAALHLDRLFAGSIFLQTWLWCAAAAALAPVLPTMCVAALAMVGYGSLALNLLRSRERQLAYSPVNRFILLYAALYLAGTFFSADLRGSLPAGALTAAFTVFSVVLYNAVTGRRQLDALIALLVLMGAAVSCYGILQYLFRWGYQSAAWVDSSMFASIQFRVPSTLDNPNMLGQYLILMIPLGGAKLLSARDWWTRLLWFCCCGAMCLCMILTFSRGAWLGLLFAGLIFVMLINPRLILLAPVVLAALYFVLPESVIGRFTSIGNLSDNSTSYRVFIWMGVLDMLASGYWLCGIGPGSSAFNRVYPAFSYHTIEAPHAHNLFLQIVCDVGVCALAVFVMVIFQYCRNLCVALKDEKDWASRILQIAFLSGVCGFMVQAMTDYSFYNYRVMFLFWVYLALGSLCARRDRLPQGGLLV
ncbi:MAG: hypothetical protein HFF39_03480 [Lawsonibacter sp.]|nr:hypothetical protein [Lawsonibacter sp.]